jgi:hypothetical protein
MMAHHLAISGFEMTINVLWGVVKHSCSKYNDGNPEGST